MNNSIDIVGIRLFKERTLLSKKNITNPLDAVEVIANELIDLDREIAMCLNLNNKNQVINAHTIAVGGMESTNIDVRSIYKSALLSNSSRILIFHNHLNTCEPSYEDIELTNIIKEGAALLGLELLDHIIISPNGFYSIKNNEKFQPEIEDNLENNLTF